MAEKKGGGRKNHKDVGSKTPRLNRSLATRTVSHESPYSFVETLLTESGLLEA